MKRKHEFYLFGHPIKEYFHIIFIFSLYIAFYILTDDLDKDNIWNIISLLYLGCCFGFYFYSNEKEKEEAKCKIEELNKKINFLENLYEINKQTIKSLREEIENNQENEEYKTN